MKKSTIVLVAVLALATGFVTSWAIKQSQPVKLEAGIWFGEQARALPEFELINHHGAAFRRQDLLGKWHLLFFGYTHCPDVCPSTMQIMADTLDAISSRDIKDALELVFVSVDPDRDSPDILQNYVQYFNPDFIAVTGTETSLKRLAKPLGINFSLDRSSSEQAIYDVSHSSAIILLNPSAEFAGVFGVPLNSQAMAADLVKLVERY
ncbi:MAG: SCO family protein [Gammaproteobacteria bacterium]|nr:SCO family protein [Gammaproteobacteria bacterium]